MSSLSHFRAAFFTLVSRLRREKLAAAVIGLSVSIHLLCIALCAKRSGDITFVLEAQMLIAVSLVSSIVIAFLDSRIHFRIVLYARILIDFAVFRILGDGGLDIKLYLMCSFHIDAAIYEPTGTGILTLITTSLVMVANELTYSFSTPFVVPWDDLAAIVLCSIVVGSGSVLVSFLREKAVVDERTIRDLDSAFDKLTSSNLGLQSYAANVQTESAKGERERITRELHDSIGYALTNIAMLMNASKVLLRGQDNEKLSALVEHARETAQACLQETRSTLYRLRSINERAPIGINALGHLSRVYSEATGTDVSIEYGNVRQSYGDAIDSAIYRFIQEGLTNAFRHNKAAKISIRVTLYEENEEITVRIWDNGAGATQITEGLGLKGMRERLAAVDGIMKYGNVIDGFVITAIIPVDVD